MTFAQFFALFTFFNNHPVARDHFDLDGDGYAQSVDCDDRDPAINPDAAEIMDGVDNDCSGGIVCEFPVEQADGSIAYMLNTITMVRSSQSPYGFMNPGRQEVLRFHLSVGHPECNGVIWKSGAPNFIWSDNDQTGWTPSGIDLYNLTDDGTTQTIWQGDLDANDQAQMNVNEYIMSGDTKMFAIYADSSDALNVSDDVMRVDIDGATMRWCSEVDENICSDMFESGIMNGNTLVF